MGRRGRFKAAGLPETTRNMQYGVGRVCEKRKLLA